MSSVGGMGASEEDLLAAQRELEAALLLDVADRAAAPESGTEKYGFENVVGVGIAEKVAGDHLTGRPARAFETT